FGIHAEAFPQQINYLLDEAVFLMAGHTKFITDWCFGLFKQKFRKTFMSSLREIEQTARPAEIVPIGLSDTRKAYLFKKIRPFCKAEEKDFVCPNPNSY
ncbi:uncharacterized protein LOC126809823, partial [Patella vulgata]|uniref:uncharacterized protein LOC126809823 n=1 Tax=Patella vulgata TaxID=6465 RepID=UPI002180167F